MSDVKPMRCETCRWFYAERGECRRRAPIFNDACGSIFPQNIQPSDYCGEHQPHTPEITNG